MTGGDDAPWAVQFILWPNTERIRRGGDDLNRGSQGFGRQVRSKGHGGYAAVCCV